MALESRNPTSEFFYNLNAYTHKIFPHGTYLIFYCVGAGSAPSPYNPHTPGSGLDSTMSDWQTTDIEVRIRDSHDDPGLVGQIGVVRSISGGMCSIFLLEEDRVVNIMGEHLEPIIPQKGDQVCFCNTFLVNHNLPLCIPGKGNFRRGTRSCRAIVINRQSRGRGQSTRRKRVNAAVALFMQNAT